MNISDFEYLVQNLETSNLMGSDAAVANLFLLKKRYEINFYKNQNFLIRKYNFSSSISGYSFPLKFKSTQKEILKDFLKEITENFSKQDIKLCLFTENQKDIFNRFIEKEFPEYIINWGTNPSDSDYIYLQKDLAELKGPKLQKKKNHISKFNRQYNNTNFIFFDKTSFSDKLKKDFIKVSELWIEEHKNDLNIPIYQEELLSILSALNHFSIFNFMGGILYIEKQPVAVTLASPISSTILDVHFEKCLLEPASFGGYSVINNYFSKHCSSFAFLNREEDLGLEGLKKAKLSYKPHKILDKYYGVLSRN